MAKNQKLKARREAERQAMKQTILNAATKIIVTEGYDSLTVRRIAAEINWSIPIIYGYFENKAKLIETLKEINLQKSSIMEVSEIINNPETKLSAFLSCINKFKNTDEYKVMELDKINSIIKYIKQKSEEND